VAQHAVGQKVDHVDAVGVQGNNFEGFRVWGSYLVAGCRLKSKVRGLN